MQQYSSLPEQNSHVDATPAFLTVIQQLRSELWLERSLNCLQNHLNDCLVSAFVPNHQITITEAEIFQTVVNDLNQALNTNTVAIALREAQEKVCSVRYISIPPPQTQILKIPMLNGYKKIRLKLAEVIDTEDLLHLENQQPQSAWELSDHSGSAIGWLIIPLPSLISSGESPQTAPHLKEQLIACASKICTLAIAKLRQIHSLQQQCQHFETSNQELKRTNLIKNQFLANTSHEIRTPLSSIIGFTHLLLAQGYDSTKERHQEYLNIIQSSGKHLLALINDILDLSKVEANQLELQCETVNVPSLCRNVIALVKEKAADKGLKLHLNIENDATSIIADSLRLKQMLLNLLFNALKFTDTGSVGLQVNINGLFMHFTVWDTGTGISTENQAELFQPYFQIPSTLVSRDQGTGLGLAVTQKLAELHGGWVKVESQINCGTTFTIVLPLHPAAIEEVDRQGKPAPGGGSHCSEQKQKTILLFPLSPCQTHVSPIQQQRVGKTTPDVSPQVIRESTTGKTLPTQWLNDYIPSSQRRSTNGNALGEQARSILTGSPFTQDILLVEDDLPNALLITTYLRNLKYQVSWVKNATKMWESLENLQPVVILLDINLPDSNGLTILQQLRANQQYHKIPVIAQTAMAMKGDRETCLAAGADDYISKPIDLQLLATALSKYSKPLQ